MISTIDTMCGKKKAGPRKTARFSWKNTVGHAALHNKIIITDEQFMQISAMADVINLKHTAKNLITGGKYEQSLFWVDEETGLSCKARPDIWQGAYVADLKTCASASYNAFQRSVFEYGYHIQCAMQFEAIKHCTGQLIYDFVFIAIEKEAPYATACYQLDNFALMQGIEEFHEALRNIRICTEANEWPSYPNAVVGLPKYAQTESM